MRGALPEWLKETTPTRPDHECSPHNDECDQNCTNWQLYQEETRAKQRFDARARMLEEALEASMWTTGKEPKKDASPTDGE